MTLVLAAAAGLLLAGPAAPLAAQAVAEAAARGDAEAVRALVRGAADVNAPQGDGMTALHWAAVNGDAELVGLLVRAGANPGAVTRNGGYDPLHLASRGGHAAVVTALLAAGSDAMAPTATARATPLHLAAASGSAEAVRALLDAGAAVDAREEAWGQTPLVFAASLGRVEVTQVLLERGADPSVTTKVVDLVAQSAVDGAARRARNQVLASFREGSPGAQGWRPTPAQVRAAVRAAQHVQLTMLDAEPDDDGPLEDGAVGGYAASVGSQGGMTPLLHAAREGHTEVAMLLLDGGADVDQAKLGDGTPPLVMAVINGRYDLALLLLERGADPNLAGSDGAAPLVSVLNNYWAPKSRYPQQLAYMSQRTSYLEVLEALLRAGADPNARMGRLPWHMLYTFGSLGVDLMGATAFWRAAHSVDVEAMRLLVAWGADPEIPTLAAPGGRGFGGGGAGASSQPVPAVWPIHAAAGVGYGQGYTANFHRHAPDGWLPAVRYLVEELGADVNALDFQGYNAVHHAASRGDDGLILYLVDRGADVTVVARNGRTTVDMANGPGQRISPHPATIALLESLGAKNNHNCVSC